jgi:hypothetical protein
LLTLIVRDKGATKQKTPTNLAGVFCLKLLLNSLVSISTYRNLEGWFVSSRTMGYGKLNQFSSSVRVLTYRNINVLLFLGTYPHVPKPLLMIREDTNHGVSG